MTGDAWGEDAASSEHAALISAGKKTALDYKTFVVVHLQFLLFLNTVEPKYVFIFSQEYYNLCTVYFELVSHLKCSDSENRQILHFHIFCKFLVIYT